MSIRSATPWCSGVPAPARARARRRRASRRPSRARRIGRPDRRSPAGRRCSRPSRTRRRSRSGSAARPARASRSRVLELGHVAVREPEPLGLAQPDAVDDARVVQRVGDDRIVLRSATSRTARRSHRSTTGTGSSSSVPRNAVSASSRSRCSCCVPQMNRTEATPKPQRSSASLRGGARSPGWIGEPEVVVRAEVHEPLARRARRASRAGPAAPVSTRSVLNVPASRICVELRVELLPHVADHGSSRQ